MVPFAVLVVELPLGRRISTPGIAPGLHPSSSWSASASLLGRLGLVLLSLSQVVSPLPQVRQEFEEEVCAEHTLKPRALACESFFHR